MSNVGALTLLENWKKACKCEALLLSDLIRSDILTHYAALCSAILDVTYSCSLNFC